MAAKDRSPIIGFRKGKNQYSKKLGGLQGNSDHISQEEEGDARNKRPSSILSLFLLFPPTAHSQPKREEVYRKRVINIR